jgi:hypothetical protein
MDLVVAREAMRRNRVSSALTALFVVVAGMFVLVSVFVPNLYQAVRLRGVPFFTEGPVTEPEEADRLAQRSVGYPFSAVRRAFQNDDAWDRVLLHDVRHHGARAGEDVWAYSPAASGAVVFYVKRGIVVGVGPDGAAPSEEVQAERRPSASVSSSPSTAHSSPNGR